MCTARLQWLLLHWVTRHLQHCLQVPLAQDASHSAPLLLLHQHALGVLRLRVVGGDSATRGCQTQCTAAAGATDGLPLTQEAKWPHGCWLLPLGGRPTCCCYWLLAPRLLGPCSCPCEQRQAAAPAAADCKPVACSSRCCCNTWLPRAACGMAVSGARREHCPPVPACCWPTSAAGCGLCTWLYLIPVATSKLLLLLLWLELAAAAGGGARRTERGGRDTTDSRPFVVHPARDSWCQLSLTEGAVVCDIHLLAGRRDLAHCCPIAVRLPGWPGYGCGVAGSTAAAEAE